jgi:hypothetical protein
LEQTTRPVNLIDDGVDIDLPSREEIEGALGQSVAIGYKLFEVVKEFVYLGSPTTPMTPTNDVSLEVQQRIQTANRCFFGLRKHLQSSQLSRRTKYTIHKTMIRPVLLYGSETWGVDQKGEEPIARI